MSGVLLCLYVIALGPNFEKSDEPELKRFEFTETHMGSSFYLVLYTRDKAAASVASKTAFARIAQLDNSLSDYNPESELMRLCDKAGGPPVKISDDLYEALARSVEMARLSEGAYDPTVGPIVRLWRRARRDRKLPERETLEKALALVDYTNIKLDPKARTAQLLKNGMKLDMGGMAKGMAAQAAVDELSKIGVKSALVAGSGDIACSDPPPDRQGWVIAIAPLGPNDSTDVVRLVLSNIAVSTSGDAEQFVEIEGVRYGHIVNPKTGVGLVDRAGVTVIVKDGALADSLDTAAFVMGPDRGLEMIKKSKGAEAVFIRKLPDGSTKIYKTDGFDKLPRSESASDAKLGPG